jgi:hypothetical protein
MSANLLLADICNVADSRRAENGLTVTTVLKDPLEKQA